MAKQDTLIPTYFEIFPSGFYPDKPPLASPLDRGDDAVARGLNMEHTDNLLWQKRPGLTRYSSALSSSEIPKNFYSFVNASSVTVVADYTDKIKQLKPSESTIKVKAGGMQSFFASVKDTLYVTRTDASAPSGPSAGAHMKRVGSSPAKLWGITPPASKPEICIHNTSGLRLRVGRKYVYVYKDSTDGHISSASPSSDDTLNFLDKTVRIRGLLSAEPRVDKIQIYATKDGGSAYFFHSEIDNADNFVTVNQNQCTLGTNVDGFWEINDNKKDSELNEALIAPINNVNDPPVGTMSVITIHEGRLWGIAGSRVVFTAHNSDGTLVNGIAEESFPPNNFFDMPSQPTALASTSSGLFVFLHDKIIIITGSTKQEFKPRQLRAKIGVGSQNAVGQDGDILYIYSTANQFLRLSDRVENIGFPLGSYMADTYAFQPDNVYVTVHRKGTLSAVFFSNFSNSTTIHFNVSTSTWSTPWVWNKGYNAVQSVQTTLNDYEVLGGAASQFVYKLDPTVHNDDGTLQTAYLAWRNFMITKLGGVSALKEIVVDYLGELVDVNWSPQEIDPDALPDANFSIFSTMVHEPYMLDNEVTINSRKFYPDLTDDFASGKPRGLIMRHFGCKLDFSNADTLHTLMGLGYIAEEMLDEH